jgi:hypothetical protein
MKILVLVIVSFDKPVYYDMLQLWKQRHLQNVWFIQCKPASEWIGDIVNDVPESEPTLRDNLELDRENKTLYVKGDECLIPGILHKTVEALSYFLSFDSAFDFVWRTNLSSVVDYAGLHKYVSNLDKNTGFYGGYVGKAQDIFFVSGAGFLMSRDVAEYLVANKASLRYDLIDDVAIGALLEPKFGIVPIDRCWVQTGEEDIESEKVFHYRCESYMHARTIEFMQYVSDRIKKQKRCFSY